MKRSDAVILGILAAATLVWGRFFLTSHLIAGTADMEIAFFKVAAVIQSWRDGLFLARWSPEINFGYGYPLLQFYAPLFFYCSAALGCLLGNIALGMNLVLLLSAFFSALAMYFFSRRWWGREAGLLAGILYLFAPYHSWDIYNRGACAEFMAFLFLPLVLLRLDRLFAKPGIRNFLFVALSAAGLVLSHSIMAMVLFPLAAVYVLFLMGMSSEKRLWKGTVTIAGLLYGVLLSAYFWLPALVEKKFVSVHRIQQGWYDFHRHFLSFKQGLFCAWTRYQEPDPTSWWSGAYWNIEPKAFQLGALYVILAGLALGVCLVLFRRERRLALVAGFWGLIAGMFIFLLTRESCFLWETVKPLSLVQFSWRFFLPLSFILCFLGVAVIRFLPDRIRWGGVVLIGGVFLLSYVSYARPFGGTSAVQIPDLKAWVYAQRPMDNMEYLPPQVKVVLPGPPPALFSIIKGDGDIVDSPQRPEARYRFSVRARTPVLVAAGHYDFPGWTVRVDGRDSKISSDNPWGIMMFVVPPGEHRVDVVFGHTKIRWIGEIVSILSGLMLMGIWGRSVLLARRARK